MDSKLFQVVSDEEHLKLIQQIAQGFNVSSEVFKNGIVGKLDDVVEHKEQLLK